MKEKIIRKLTAPEQAILENVQVRLINENDQLERERFRELMLKYHYLESDTLVGEQMRYVAHVGEEWLALLSWSAAAKHLKWRDQWIGWNAEQLRRRRAFIANNARFLILPGVQAPNLASRVLALCSKRLSEDWQSSYGHGILAVESFVDGQLFRGTCYKAQGWQQLGATRGFERKSADYFVEHKLPKQLWVKELVPNARALLSAPELPLELKPVEDKVVPQPQLNAQEMRNLWQLCRAVPEWRKRKGRDYPLPCVLAIIVMASFCGVVRGQRDLAAFASKLTQPQLRVLRSYKRPDGKYDYPKETTFQRVLANLDTTVFERILNQWSAQKLGDAHFESDELVAIDGKSQRGSTPNVSNENKAQVVSAQSLPSGRVLGSVLVEKKSNEIPAARQLLEKLGDLDGKLCMLDALHTNQETLRQIVQESGADYLLPVKGNHEGLEQRAQAVFDSLPKEPVGEDAGPPVSSQSQSAQAAAGGFPPLKHPINASGQRTAVRHRRRGR